MWDRWPQGYAPSLQTSVKSSECEVAGGGRSSLRPIAPADLPADPLAPPEMEETVTSQQVSAKPFLLLNTWVGSQLPPAPAAPYFFLMGHPQHQWRLLGARPVLAGQLQGPGRCAQDELCRMSKHQAD